MLQKIMHVVVLIALVCILPSCENVPELLDPASDEVRHAEKLQQEGKYQEAAALLWSLAETKKSPQREALQIRAVEAVLYPATRLQAQQYLNTIDESALMQDLLVRKRVATAELALMNGQSQLALNTVPVKLIELSLKYKPHVLAVRAKALHAIGKIRTSIETRIVLGPLLKEAKQINENNQLIWQSLLDENSEEINLWMNSNKNPELIAWLDLVAIQKQAHENLSILENQLQQWRARYPNNRVPNHIVDSIAQDWASLRISPNKIALLLPMTGHYSDVAKAIYAGIMTAREFSETFNSPPEIILYDTGSDPASAVGYYHRAVNEGADFVIGPLQKDAVEKLANQGQLEVPTLSLNYADDVSIGLKKLFQFGLLPEDEAKQAAERATLGSHQEALVLIPDSEWGTRVLEAFTTRFLELGGVVLQFERYDAKSADHSAPIKNLLQLDQSEQRRRHIQSIIGKEVKFEPRRRQDADFIFIAASPRQARLLRPQLRYHYASNLPVYATSHVFSGNENISADQDINGIIYCDIPWLLSHSATIELLRDTLDLQQSSSQSRLPRFAALGIDAYQVIPHLQRLAAYEFARYAGMTGKLSISGQNRIYRELIWAKFHNGYPRNLSTMY